MTALDLSEIVKNYATAVGVVATGLYFALRLRLGYFIQNLTLEVDLSRSPNPVVATNDFVAAKISITKGDRNTTRLYSLELYVSWPGCKKAEYRRVATIQRLAFDYLKGPATHIHFGEVHSTNPLLNVTPGESIVMAEIFEVPTDVPCTVEAILIGKKKGGSKHWGQWRASAVSAPRTVPSPSSL
jgi:hypothetical protein